MSNIAEVAIYLAVLAAGWVAYVVWHVLRRRKKHSAPGNADAYEGNLVVPVLGSKHPGRSGTHALHDPSSASSATAKYL